MFDVKLSSPHELGSLETYKFKGSLPVDKSPLFVKALTIGDFLDKYDVTETCTLDTILSYSETIRSLSYNTCFQAHKEDINGAVGYFLGTNGILYGIDEFCKVITKVELINKTNDGELPQCLDNIKAKKSALLGSQILAPNDRNLLVHVQGDSRIFLIDLLVPKLVSTTTLSCQEFVILDSFGGSVTDFNLLIAQNTSLHSEYSVDLYDISGNLIKKLFQLNSLPLIANFVSKQSVFIVGYGFKNVIISTRISSTSEEKKYSQMEEQCENLENDNVDNSSPLLIWKPDIFDNVIVEFELPETSPVMLRSASSNTVCWKLLDDHLIVSSATLRESSLELLTLGVLPGAAYIFASKPEARIIKVHQFLRQFVIVEKHLMYVYVQRSKDDIQGDQYIIDFSNFGLRPRILGILNCSSGWIAMVCHDENPITLYKLEINDI